MLNREHMQRYFAAGSYYLAAEMERQHIPFGTGKDALYLIKEGKLSPENIYIICELNARDSEKLAIKGAHRFVLQGLESRFYASHFYDSLNRRAPQYDYVMTFRHMLLDIHPKKQCIPIHYPVYSQKDIDCIPSLSFQGKKGDIVYVLSNKQNGGKRLPVDRHASIEYNLKVTLAYFLKPFSKTLRQIKGTGLFGYRRDIIEFLAEQKGLSFDLFGRGWDNLDDIQSEKFRKAIESLHPKAVDDKTKVISHYKYALAIENNRDFDYITEKIFDVMMSGSVPIYLGAPNVEEYIPKDCFINAAEYSSFEELFSYVKSIDEEQYSQYQKNIRNFLSSEDNPFSMEEYTRTMMNLFMEA